MDNCLKIPLAITGVIAFIAITFMLGVIANNDLEYDICKNSEIESRLVLSNNPFVPDRCEFLDEKGWMPYEAYKRKHIYDGMNIVPRKQVEPTKTGSVDDMIKKIQEDCGSTFLVWKDNQWNVFVDYCKDDGYCKYQHVKLEDCLK